MTDEEMKRLEDIAKAATPGPWRRCGTEEKPIPVVTTTSKDGYQLHNMLRVKHDSPDVYENMRDTYNRDAAHIAAANPSAVLSLIERVRKAERKGAEEMRKAAAIEAEVEGDVGCDECRGEFYGLRDRIRAIKLPGDAP